MLIEAPPDRCLSQILQKPSVTSDLLIGNQHSNDHLMEVRQFFETFLPQLQQLEEMTSAQIAELLTDTRNVPRQHIRPALLTIICNLKDSCPVQVNRLFCDMALAFRGKFSPAEAQMTRKLRKFMEAILFNCAHVWLTSIPEFDPPT